VSLHVLKSGCLRNGQYSSRLPTSATATGQFRQCVINPVSSRTNSASEARSQRVPTSGVDWPTSAHLPFSRRGPSDNLQFFQAYPRSRNRTIDRLM